MKTLNQNQSINFLTINAMKNVLKTLVLCLFTSVAFAQAKSSMEELTFSNNDKIVKLNISSQNISNKEGFFMYYVSITANVPNKTVSNVILKEYGKTTVVALNNVTHIQNLYLPNLGSLGEAYAYKGTGTSVSFYFLKANSNGDTWKVLFYVPAGPQNISIGN